MRRARRLRWFLVVALSLAMLGQWVTTPFVASAAVYQAVGDDPENRLIDCENRVGIGVERDDTRRCITFRFTVPPEGINRAYVHVSTKTSSLMDTDLMFVAVAQSFPECQPVQGQMPGCVLVNGGLTAGQISLDLNLLDLDCNPQNHPGYASLPPADRAIRQQAVIAQLNTGVLHFELSDDTAVLAAELVINEGPDSITCGGSTSNVNPATGQPPAGGTGTGTGPGTGTGGNVPGNLVPTPPFGTPEPPPVGGMTIFAGQRQGPPGAFIWLPIWMLNATDVANINFEVSFNEAVANDEGPVKRGNYLAGANGAVNQSPPGNILIGVSQASGESGTGVISWISFRITGQPGQSTPITLKVTTINDSTGAVLSIDRIDGLIRVTTEDGEFPGDCNGDGQLTEADAYCALQMSVRNWEVRMVMDVDRDGQVTSRDSSVILRGNVRAQ